MIIRSLRSNILRTTRRQASTSQPNRRSALLSNNITRSKNVVPISIKSPSITSSINLSHPFSTESTDKPEAKKESLEFQAETKQLLDIVTHSLYTDKEVFLRELISNASDALEKLRHLQVANEGSSSSKAVQQDPDLPLEIKIETDEVNGTITISDSGIGLSRQEMIDHLGTIARSGSKAFMNELAQKHSSDGANLDASRGIIGKFGVGFYSAFMVGDRVEVRSK